ncbi:MAG: bacterial transcriptional activator domain-containing protein [Planctomycetota bacterium]
MPGHPAIDGGDGVHTSANDAVRDALDDAADDAANTGEPNPDAASFDAEHRATPERRAIRPFRPVRTRRICQVGGAGLVTIRDPGTFIVKGPIVDPTYAVVDHRLLALYDPKTWGYEREPEAPAAEVDPIVAAVEEAEAMLRAGHRRRAADRLERALRAEPDATPAWELYAAALLACGRTAEAMERLHQVYSVDPVLLLEARDAAGWFPGGERELRERATRLHQVAKRMDSVEGWVASSAVALWAGDVAQAQRAERRARASGADASLCDRLAWAASLRAVGGLEGAKQEGVGP